MGAKRAELVKYMTSAEVSGDYGSVVGYAGVIVS
jgi:AmmeMemoRadiSam system protein B